jgi:hypothetical protein
MVNGFYAKGRSDVYNVDGSGSKTDITDKKILITAKDSTTILGCTGKLS